LQFLRQHGFILSEAESNVDLSFYCLAYTTGMLFGQRRSIKHPSALRQYRTDDPVHILTCLDAYATLDPSVHIAIITERVEAVNRLLTLFAENYSDVWNVNCRIKRAQIQTCALYDILQRLTFYHARSQGYTLE
jgi:hypothetical protein